MEVNLCKGTELHRELILNHLISLIQSLDALLLMNIWLYQSMTFLLCILYVIQSLSQYITLKVQSLYNRLCHSSLYVQLQSYLALCLCEYTRAHVKFEFDQSFKFQPSK